MEKDPISAPQSTSHAIVKCHGCGGALVADGSMAVPGSTLCAPCGWVLVMRGGVLRYLATAISYLGMGRAADAERMIAEVDHILDGARFPDPEASIDAHVNHVAKFQRCRCEVQQRRHPQDYEPQWRRCALEAGHAGDCDPGPVEEGGA